MCILFYSCGIETEGIIPRFISDKVMHDSDDPAIWLHPYDVSESLILGTDKGEDGSLYVFDIRGREIKEKSVHKLNRPNNVDVEYGVPFRGSHIDIAVITERGKNRLRIYKLPELEPVDGGKGISVFEGEQNRDCMGIGIYKNPHDNSVYAIISRKAGPSGTYLWQYALRENNNGFISGIHVRSFGLFSGTKEIESIAVDDELGYVYYSDEGAGIRKYYADPERINVDIELGFFGTDDFSQDMEGLAIYTLPEGQGYILVSDQQRGCINIYPREGAYDNPNKHLIIKSVPIAALLCDGIEVVATHNFASFPGGLVVCMSEGRIFHYYAWDQFVNAPGTLLRKY